MKPHHWIIAAIALILLAMVFQLGCAWGQLHSDVKCLQSSFSHHCNETHLRLSSLEADRDVRERRIACFKKALVVLKRLPIVRWASGCF